MVIQDGEVWEFYSHFSSWPFVDLKLAERFSALYLPTQNEPDFPAPTNSQTKVTQCHAGSGSIVGKVNLWGGGSCYIREISEETLGHSFG